MDFREGTIIDLQINYHILYEMYRLWEDVILGCGYNGP